MRFAAIMFLSAGLLFTGCVSSKITSQKDPFFKGAPMKRFLFVMNTASLEQQQEMESRAVEEFASLGLVAIPYSQALPPVREYTTDEVRSVIRERDIEGYIELSLDGIGRANIQLPAVSETTSSAKITGNGTYATARGNSTTVTHGGGSTSVMTGLTWRAKVLSAETANTVWRGEISIDLTRTSGYAQVGNIYDKVLSEIAEKMQEDGIAVSKPRR